MWIVYWALAFAIVVVSLALATAVVMWVYYMRSFEVISEEEPEEPMAQLKAEQDVVKSFEDDLAIVRSARFGRSMHPAQRRVPERLRKE